MTEKLGLEVVKPPPGSLVRLQARLDRGQQGLRLGIVAAGIAIAMLMVFTGNSTRSEISMPTVAETYLAHRSATIDPRTLRVRDGAAVMVSCSAAARVYLVDTQ